MSDVLTAQSQDDRKVNIYDISRESGVSIATVSRVMNNSGYVSDKTRKKVMDVIQRNGYSPNAFARGMSKSTMSIVGILCSDSRDPYQAECIYWLQKDLAQAGYTAMLCCTGEDLKTLEGDVSLLLSRSVDALICIGSGFAGGKEKNWEALVQAAAKVPVILLNGEMEKKNIYSIVCDDEKGMQELTSLVLKTGGVSPLFLAGSPSPSSQDKLRGFRQCMKDHGFDDKEIRVTAIEADLDKMSDELKKIYEEKPFDAILCCDDQTALGALKFTEQNHLKVPEQVQITGYNGSLLSRLSSLQITTYDNRLSYLCSQAVFALQAVLSKQSYPRQSLYTGQLIPGETTRQTPTERKSGFGH